MNRKTLLFGLIGGFLLAGCTQTAPTPPSNEKNAPPAANSTLGFTIPSSQIYKTAKVSTKNQVFEVYVADSTLKRAQGLMFITEMPKNAGMLFTFDSSDIWGFYMRNTKIPLDIIWIDEAQTVQEIVTMQPCDTQECPTHVPKTKAKWVLEVNAGEFGGQIGDKIEISF